MLKPAQRDSIRLTLPEVGEVALLCVCDARAKRIKLTVNERGVRLTLPPRTNVNSATHFLNQHQDWLSKQLAANRVGTEPLVRGVTSSLPLRGCQVPMCWRQGCFAQLVHEQTGGLCFLLPDTSPHASIIRALRDFYEASARFDIARWLPQYLPRLPRPPSRIRLKVMSSQWGSLAPDGALTLDLALVLGPPAAFEYVLVHELCHLIHANHSADFWHAVETRCPDWRLQHDWLCNQGRRLKAQLHALLRDDSTKP